LLKFKGFTIEEVFYAIPPTAKELVVLGLTEVKDWMCKRIGVIAS
jgi:hypothetical protein